MNDELRQDIWRKLKALHEGIWEGQASSASVERWLDNFVGSVVDRQTERDAALYLLSKFQFLGELEVRQLLRAVYRDLVRTPILSDIRGEGVDDLRALDREYSREINRTRFLGIGNPSESGTHLLYFFRQENRLPKSLFCNVHEVLGGPIDQIAPRLQSPTVTRYVFIDDFCSTGDQALRYSSNVVEAFRRAAERSKVQIKCEYYVIAAVDTGISRVRRESYFDRVDCVIELDETNKAFAERSRILPSVDLKLDIASGLQIFGHYGAKLCPSAPLGYGDGQLLFGFHHNIPDNSLPVFWGGDDGNAWETLFRRFPKE